MGLLGVERSLKEPEGLAEPWWLHRARSRVASSPKRRDGPYEGDTLGTKGQSEDARSRWWGWGWAPMVVVPGDSRMLSPQRSPKDFGGGGVDGGEMGVMERPVATTRGCTSTTAPLHPYSGSEFHPNMRL